MNRILLALVLPVFVASAQDFVAAVKATRPLAFYRLQSATGSSETGHTAYTLVGGGTATDAGAPIGRALRLDGRSGWISTTQNGGIDGAASIMLWVNLAALPSQDGHYFYLAGESESGNDLDLQFENDNALRFYTAAGSNISFVPDPASLVGQWHMVVATVDTVAHARSLYWDGRLVMHDEDSGTPVKTHPFSIGASTVFDGRYLDGSVADAALWNRALKANEVAGIYSASGGAAASTAAAPAPPADTGSRGELDRVVKETGPLAYYRLRDTHGASESGPTFYASVGGATVADTGAPIGPALRLDGRSGWVNTTLRGGITHGSSIMAWVNLATLPSEDGHFFYVAGESERGNDLDLQFENDNVLRFYTAAGSHLSYAPDPSTLVGQWHMIVATVNATAHTRSLYWDGRLAVSDRDTGRPVKTARFTIGASSVFEGRFFDGSIGGAGLWNRPLTAAEVSRIYAAANGQ